MQKKQVGTFAPESLDLFVKGDCFIIRERPGMDYAIGVVDADVGWAYATAKRFPTLELAYVAANKMGFTRAFRIGAPANLAGYTGRKKVQ